MEIEKQNRKRVLIVTYYWPPAGGITVLRCLKFAKYLRDFGWEPVIYTALNPSYPYLDEWNNKDVPAGIEVLKQPIIEPFDLFKKLSGRKKTESLNNVVHVRDKKSLIDDFAIWVRGNFFIPDARSLWAKPSVKFLNKYLKEHPVDAILSDGPPHTNTWIAYQVAEHNNIPWLADFQDPWTQVDYYALFKIWKWADQKHKRMEQLCLQRANKITIASPTWKKDLEDIGAENVEVIYYGYDEDDFKKLSKNTAQKFVISHAGLLGFDRSPGTFIKAMQRLIAERPNISHLLELSLAGQVDFSIVELIKSAGLEQNTNYLGLISRMDALQLMLDSQLLLLPLNKADNAKGRLPGKIYEYLRAESTILVFGPIDSDAAKIIEDTQRGACFTYENEEGIYTFLKEQFENWEKGVTLNTSGEIESFSNKNQTKRIAAYLDEITEG